jgi:regulator of replication initiation timing
MSEAKIIFLEQQVENLKQEIVGLEFENKLLAAHVTRLREDNERLWRELALPRDLKERK